ncbi:MAG: class I SAM-dependent methyltransferase [Pseudomonadota bacterium]|uniref:class I SAM-dependent methyltransferase n=1 Tax=unclassified Phenylobacterium TaxID=2640670 RepID=UPI0006F5DAA2|nr:MULTISPECIES: class I SAM-dependent methyltransferase [unclassified Phenylobacterium]KRB52215.1 phospholipid methyltransferase [Phenylobacterium sp. Root700]MBT9473390.1 class I SAM-dependent methyltransferase [Phenylobacterium sp.]
MASFYERHILPALLTRACSSPPMMKQRAKIVPLAEGRVLELGIGMGLNLGLYDAAKVESVTGVDPAPELRAIAEAAPRDPRLKVTVADGTAEALPFEDASFDTVVCTFTLCSVHGPAQALSEARRVLKPGGRFLYCEHGLAPDHDVAKWQRRVEPIWKRLAGGCHLTRPIAESIGAAGFRLGRVQTMYVPGTPRIAGWNEWGEALA